MFIQNKYTKWYYQITSRAQLRASTRKEAKALFRYTEYHHILPESIGGLKTKDNMVFLTPREHFICHWLLTKMTVGNYKAKMIYALNGMKRNNKHQDRYTTKISSRVYAHNKILSAKQHSEFMKGRVPPNKGVPMSEEQKVAIGIRNKGRVKTQEEIDKRVAKVTGQKRTPQQRENMSHGMTGILKGPMSQEEKDKRSRALKNKPKPSGFGDKVAVRMRDSFTKNNPNKREDLKKLCPHCGIKTGPTNYTRWHGDNCRSKK